MEYFIILNDEDGQHFSFFGTPWSVKTEKWLLLQGADCSSETEEMRYKWNQVVVLTVFKSKLYFKEAYLQKSKIRF